MKASACRFDRRCADLPAPGKPVAAGFFPDSPTVLMIVRGRPLATAWQARLPAPPLTSSGFLTVVSTGRWWGSRVLDSPFSQAQTMFQKQGDLPRLPITGQSV